MMILGKVIYMLSSEVWLGEKEDMSFESILKYSLRQKGSGYSEDMEGSLQSLTTLLAAIYHHREWLPPVWLVFFYLLL